MGYDVVPLNKLIDQFARLPGIGRKTAQRMAFYILNLSSEEALSFADSIIEAKNIIKRCKTCQNLSDVDECTICSDNDRDKSVICVVQNTRDVLAFERIGEYNGSYHILHGLISPMEGISPNDLTIKELLARLYDGKVKEVIMATNPTIEGEATAMYLSKLIKPFSIKVTRLAYGIPVGGNLEYADELTLNRALQGRCEM